jgi:hypothetical protein
MTPQMTGGDLVVCRESEPGVILAHDYHAVGNQEPFMDDKQDWTTHYSGRTADITFCETSRAWVGCDKKQVPATFTRNTLF